MNLWYMGSLYVFSVRVGLSLSLSLSLHPQSTYIFPTFCTSILTHNSNVVSLPFQSNGEWWDIGLTTITLLLLLLLCVCMYVCVCGPEFCQLHQAIKFDFFFWNIRHIEVHVMIFKGSESTHVIEKVLFIEAH